MDGGRQKKKKEERRKRRRRMNVDYNLIKKCLILNYIEIIKKEEIIKYTTTIIIEEEDPGGPLCQVDRWTDRPLLLLLVDRL